MGIENYKWLAALIAAHPQQSVYGRTRLQKEVKLLQRLEFPTDYPYTIHFYGPYSESLQGDISMLDVFGYIEESSATSQDGKPYYILRSRVTSDLPSVNEFSQQIKLLNDASAVVLELAATYDAFREAGADHEEALERLRRKKGSKCEGDNEEKAFSLLNALGLAICPAL